jgi:hypothetical protein
VGIESARLGLKSHSCSRYRSCSALVVV